uniref:Polyprotein n=1 Tax=Lake cress torradovirus TaxID=3115804 RepID=A0AAT9JAX0_9SECO
MTSLNPGRQTGLLTSARGSEEISRQIQNFYDAVEQAHAGAKADGMGCFTVVRAEKGKKMVAELMAKEDQQKIRSTWDVLKLRKVKKKDTGLLYFHLHGIIFIMVPHVGSHDLGEVCIELCSFNDPTTPIDTVTMKLSAGPAVALMAPPFCLPMMEDSIMFYYKTTCNNTNAQIPCSVLALWNQEITHKTAAYREEQVATWALERLSHPKFFQDKKHAAQALAGVYGSANKQNDMQQKPFIGFEKYLDKMNVYPDQIAPKPFRSPSLKVQSKRFKDLYIEDPTCVLSTHEEEDGGGPSLVSASLYTNENLVAQSYEDYYRAFYLNAKLGFYGEENAKLILRHTEFAEENAVQLFESEMALHGAKILAVIPEEELSTCYTRFGLVPPIVYAALECDKHPQQPYDENMLQELGVTRLQFSTVVLAVRGAWKKEERIQEEYGGSLSKTDRALVATKELYSAAQMKLIKEEERIKRRARLRARVCKLVNIAAVYLSFLWSFLVLMSTYMETWKRMVCCAIKNAYVYPPEAQTSQSTVEGYKEESSLSSGAEIAEVNNTFSSLADIPYTNVVPTLASSPNLFNFTTTAESGETSVELELSQPAVVTSNEVFEAGIFEFEWKATDVMCKELLNIPLPEALLAQKNSFHAGSSLLNFFDAAVIEYSATLNLSASFAVTGELVLLWDEGDSLGTPGRFLNQASLLVANYTRYSASQSISSSLKFTPVGVGDYVPLDKEMYNRSLGSLRVYVLFELVSGDPTLVFPGHVHLKARVVRTNIMQPTRLVPQFEGGVKIQEATLPEIPCSQVLLTSKWQTDAPMGTSALITFSPSGVFEQQGVLQSSLVCNLFRNCKWWTGECDFELHFDKTPFHSGSLAVGFGTLATDLRNQYDVFNMSNVVANLSEGHTFSFSIEYNAWNGKNLLSAGRKSSLPRFDHHALLRIFVVVVKPLVTTNQDLKSVNLVLMLKRIKNFTVGGSTPIKPILGHWHKGKSGVDYFFSESSGAQRDHLGELLKQNLPVATQGRSLSNLVPQISLREKLSPCTKQYVLKSIDQQKRYLVLPVAPWVHSFPNSGKIVASELNPLIDICSGFIYWQGDLHYTIVLHRKQNSPNIGGNFTVTFDSSGFPIDPGLHEGQQPLASGGGPSWVFTYGATALSHSFTIQDDKFFPRRWTRRREFNKERSRIETLQDRLGELKIYLPSDAAVNQVEIYVGLGENFSFSVARAPVASAEKLVGDMESNVFILKDNAFQPAEGVASTI